MRTKTLILAGAMAVLGTTASFAQVYSQNTVGFYTINLAVGFNLIANQMNAQPNNNINTIIPGTSPLNDGATLIRWDCVAQDFYTPEIFLKNYGWVNQDTGELSTTVLNPGEGAFIGEVSDPVQIVLLGDVPEGTLTKNTCVGQQIISQLTPQALGLEASGFPANDGDTLVFWNTGRWAEQPLQDFITPYIYFGGGTGWISQITGLQEDVVPQLGEAMFYNNTGAAAPWTRTFDVSP